MACTSKVRLWLKWVGYKELLEKLKEGYSSQTDHGPAYTGDKASKKLSSCWEIPSSTSEDGWVLHDLIHKFVAHLWMDSKRSIILSS